MKKKSVLLGFMFFLLLGSVPAQAAYEANFKLNDEDYIYLSDDLLRSSISFDGLYDTNSPLVDVFQVKQLKKYPSDSIGFESGRSIEGLQNLPETVTHFEGSESEVKDITPLFEMQQLTDIKLVTGFIDDNKQLNQLFSMENLKTLKVYDDNTAFKSFDVEIPETLKNVDYGLSMDMPTQLVEQNKKFQMANPIALTNYESNKGTLKFDGGIGFSFENNILTWENSKDVPKDLKWEYKDISNNKNIKIYGSLYFDTLIVN